MVKQTWTLSSEAAVVETAAIIFQRHPKIPRAWELHRQVFFGFDVHYPDALLVLAAFSDAVGHQLAVGGNVQNVCRSSLVLTQRVAVNQNVVFPIDTLAN